MKTKDKKSKYGDDKEALQIEEFFEKRTEDKQRKQSLEMARKLTPKK